MVQLVSLALLAVVALCAVPIAIAAIRVLRVLPDVEKALKLRKPLATFLETGTEALKGPVKIAEATENFMGEISSICQAAVLGHDVIVRQEAALAAYERNKVGAPPTLASASAAPAPALAADAVKVPEPELFGAGAGEVRRVEAGVSYSSDTKPSLPGRPIGALGGASRDLQLGAASGNDGTAGGSPAR